MVVGEACGGMYAVTVSEKNSVGLIYDVAYCYSLCSASFHRSRGEGLYHAGQVSTVWERM